MSKILALFLCFGFILAASADDWPMWRYDAGRTACGPEELPRELHPLWVRHYPEREMVWDDSLNQDLMPFDKVFEPIVLGKTMYIGFNDRDKVVAIDTETGGEMWTFYADGPIRLPLAGWKDRLFFTSDDGYLYSVSAKSGKLIWKFRGGPADRKILGNKRLISAWPARGGAVLQGGTVYFAASIWPFMGIYIYALNAETGDVVWQNEGTGSQYMKQPHNSPAFAGVAPQGTLVVSGEKLLIPGGRSIPACFDRRNGEMLYYHLAKYNKTGGAFVCASDRYFFNHYRDRETDLYDLTTGETIGRKVGKYPVLSNKTFYMSGDSIAVRDAGNPLRIRSVLKVDASGDLIQSGSRLYAGGDGQITAVQILAGGELNVAWSQKVDGKIGRLLAANGRLFAVTLDGKIIAFGEKNVPVRPVIEKAMPWQPSGESAGLARDILLQTQVTEGYALFCGVGDGDLIAALAMASDLRIVAVDSDAEKINRLRRDFDKAGLLGLRIHLLCGLPSECPAPPHMASLTVFADPDVDPAEDRVLKKWIPSMRPFGGKAWFPLRGARQKAFAMGVEQLNDPMLSVQFLENGTLLSKNGPLPGASNWTHQYGNISNTVKSDDELVRLPLGILWFGGNSNIEVLPRHGHGPPEQVVDGRLIIEGMDGLSARDVYTGRILWVRKLDSLGTFGKYYNETHQHAPLKVISNQEHIPGANAVGTNFVATTDRIYVLGDRACHVLDITTGKTERNFTLPQNGPAEDPPLGYIGIANANLIVGSGKVSFSTGIFMDETEVEKRKTLSKKDLHKLEVFTNYDWTASKSLFVMDRHDGSVKWKIDSRYGFIHNAIAAGENRLFCLDKVSPALEKKLVRRGLPVPSDFRLLAIDLETGKIVWEKNTDLFGSWLSYSRETGCLLEATRPSRDMVTDETGERMAVYRASNGDLLWDKKIKYNNPPILHHDRIITDDAAYSLATGEKKLRTDPLTGEQIPWAYSRTYGCNYNIASEYLLSFRSAAAGFYDLYSEGGTGNYGGFKSGCTSNLIAAGGVLNAPDYTRTCQCSYQNQTSLALIHMPELEYWTTNDFFWNGEPIRNVGINLNAPGDRIAQDGTLWLDFPSVGGPSPDIPIQCDSLLTRRVRRHSLSLKSNGYEWVAASGLAGPIELKIMLSSKPMLDALYTVHLHFAELENKKPSQRVFDVYLQGNKVLQDFDIAKEAGGSNIPLIKSFHGVPVVDRFTVQCVSRDSTGKNEPILCGIELRREK